MDMKKNIKATLAIAAGVALLMGGAGSMAYWTSTVNAGPGAGGNAISAGSLSVVPANAGTWNKYFYNASGTLVTSATANGVSLSSVAIVPGNRLVYTQTFNINASGGDLWFTIASTNGAVTGATNSNTTQQAANTALATQINASSSTGLAVSTAVSGGNVVSAGSPNTYKLNSSTGPSTITVTWTIDFPFGSTADSSAQLGVVNLSQGSITLTQVPAQ